MKRDKNEYNNNREQLQTIVEVINPMIGGDGSANKIVIGRSPDGCYSSIETPTSELSLNAKMKNVLQELLENDRVKLNLSKSLIEDDNNIDEEDNEDEIDGEIYQSSSVERNGNKTVFYVREKLINDYYSFEKDSKPTDDETIDNCQVYENPNFKNSPDKFIENEKIASSISNNDENEKIKEKLLLQLNVDELKCGAYSNADDNEEDNDNDGNPSIKKTQTSTTKTTSDDACDDGATADVIATDDSANKTSESKTMETTNNSSSSSNLNTINNNNTKKKKRKGKKGKK